MLQVSFLYRVNGCMWAKALLVDLNEACGSWEMWGCAGKSSFCLADLHSQFASHVYRRYTSLTNWCAFLCQAPHPH